MGLGATDSGVVREIAINGRLSCHPTLLTGKEIIMEYVKISKELLDKLTLLCDLSELSSNPSAAKIARESRCEIDKGLNYV
jgi:hypothetical protein